jgi:hypothetical protein
MPAKRKAPPPRPMAPGRTQQSPDADMLTARSAQAAKVLAGALRVMIPAGGPIDGGDATTIRQAKQGKGKGRGR